MSSLPEVVLKPRKAAPFFGRHPWVLDSAVDTVRGGEPADGDVVELLAENGHWIARGIYNHHSRIRVRLYSWQKEEALDIEFWRRRIVAALALREQIGYAANDAARLIYSEADGLSGLIVDRFGQYLVVQPTAIGIATRIDQLVPLLVELTGAKGVIVRAEPSMAKLEGFVLPMQVLSGEVPDAGLAISEHGVQYQLQLSQGQKTGFYLDQRENRRVAANYLAGRNVLDMCCYTGGFSLTAAKHGAAHVTGVDSSRYAIEQAQANAKLNGLENVEFQVGEAFETLEALHAEGKKFGGIVLDPPKFAKGRRGVDDALRAYHRLNQMAVALLEPQGILVTCSCSGGVMSEDFQSMLLGVAMKTKRDIQMLEQRGASPDHPVAVMCAENAYLKCFICRVL